MYVDLNRYIEKVYLMHELPLFNTNSGSLFINSKYLNLIKI